MKDEIKNLIYILILVFVVCALLVTCFVVAANIVLDKEDIKLEARSSSGSSYALQSGITNLIGTGIELNSGVASSTDQSTYFQFPTSTNETYWDENNPTRFPDKLMTATPTIAIATQNADLITLEFTYDPFIDASEATCNFFQSNDSNCATNATNTAELYPLNFAGATSTPGDINNTGVATTSITFTSNDEVKHNLTINNINADCIIMQCGNNSTTDGSLLHVNSRIK